jgi:hypothetical protein
LIGSFDTCGTLMMRTLRFVSMLVVALLFANAATAVPLVYTGFEVNFTKDPGADHTLPANQDAIVPGVAITRGMIRGIYNIAQENQFFDNSSPAGTAWAFVNNNPSATLSATNWAALSFADWQTANGGGGGGPTNTVGQNAVLHLIDQDIYLDIHFTDWGVGEEGGGSFAYNRAEIIPSADFDRDGDIDGQDFLTWQRNFGASPALQSQGDADFDGVVDADDLAVWQGAYGSPLLAVTAVPEPTTLYLTGLVLLSLAKRRR